MTPTYHYTAYLSYPPSAGLGTAMAIDDF
jgi:hypothetical protein